VRLNIEGDGPRSLLVLPGWRLDSQTETPDWLPVLAERPGWRGVFADLPGTGVSRDDLRDVRTQRDVLTRVLEAVDGPQLKGPIALAGTSNGAALALAVVRSRPGRVRGLALRVPMLEADDAARLADGQPEWQREFDALPAAYRRAHDVKVREVWEPARRLRSEVETLMAIRDDAARYGLGDARAPERFAAPSLIVLGRQDAVVGWRRACSELAGLSRATVVVLDQAGHALPVGAAQVELWRALARDWLDRVDAHWDGPQ
jgi:pimeloyl-ACP methyl ester carboxylesterase